MLAQGTSGGLHPVDWLVMAAYAAAVLWIGLRAGRGPQSPNDLHLGQRRMPVWAVMCSMVATELSAATFIGVPHAAYTGDWSYLQFACGALLGKGLLSVTFIPLYHRLGVVTVYGFIDHRFGPGARRATAACFVLGRLVASGVRLYIAALAFHMVTGLSLQWAIITAGGLAALYTCYGGIRAVIWTDTLQGAVFLIAAGSILAWIAAGVEGGLPGIFEWAAAHGDRTRIFRFPDYLEGPAAWWVQLAADGRSFYAALIGGCVLSLATHSTDHDMVQRLLTTRDGPSGARALLGSALSNFPLSALFLCIGTGLAVYYATHAVAYSIEDHARIVPIFAIHELPIGVRGLLFAGLFAATMSSLDSTIWALTTTSVVDLLNVPWLVRSARATRLFALAVSVPLIGAALLMERASRHYLSGGTSLVELALGSMTIVYGGLLGVFLVGLLTRTRGTAASVRWALATGIVLGLVGFLQPQILTAWYGEEVTTPLVAWPWQMCISTLGAALVALCGRRPGPAPALPDERARPTQSLEPVA